MQPNKLTVDVSNLNTVTLGSGGIAYLGAGAKLGPIYKVCGVANARYYLHEYGAGIVEDLTHQDLLWYACRRSGTRVSAPFRLAHAPLSASAATSWVSCVSVWNCFFIIQTDLQLEQYV